MTRRVEDANSERLGRLGEEQLDDAGRLRHGRSVRRHRVLQQRVRLCGGGREHAATPAISRTTSARRSRTSDALPGQGHDGAIRPSAPTITPTQAIVFVEEADSAFDWAVAICALSRGTSFVSRSET
jgi:hypothetical protein